MWFNHHHLLDDLKIGKEYGPCIPQSQKDWKAVWHTFTWYFSKTRIEQCEDVLDLFFKVSLEEFKENVINKEKRFNLITIPKYLLNKFRDWVVGWYNVYRNRWRNGFYDGETFSLDYTSAIYLYERVKRYKQLAKEYVKLGIDDYTEEEIAKGEHPHQYTIPVLRIKDIDTCKSNFDLWWNKKADHKINWCYDIEYKDMYLEDCIDLVLQYLARYLKSENGNYFFKDNYINVYDNSLEDYSKPDCGFTAMFEKADREHPDHMFWNQLEEHWSWACLSYAFQIYGIIIKSMWW